MATHASFLRVGGDEGEGGEELEEKGEGVGEAGCDVRNGASHLVRVKAVVRKEAHHFACPGITFHASHKMRPVLRNVHFLSCFAEEEKRTSASVSIGIT